MIQLLEAYDYKKEIEELVTEYTQMLIQGDPTFQKYLQIQGLDKELEDLDSKYGLPEGRLYLLFVDHQPAGCIGLKKLDSTTCEMKRLYVRPAYRGKHLAQILVEKIIEEAQKIGYHHMRLDTVPFLQSAVHLYKEYGFYEIEAYTNSPVGDSIYMQLDL